MIRTPRMMLAVALTMVVVGCGAEPTGRASIHAARDTLEGGAVRVRYGALPDSADRPTTVDLRIGALDGDPVYVFGDVRGIQADSEGTIYVLDYQASEIRVFDDDGRYVRTIGSEGQGPGEMEEANGMILSGDTLLWVQDHAKWRFLGLRTDGTEIHRIQMHVLNYGYMWNGTVDEAGRFWKPTSHSDEPRGRPEEGLQERASRAYFVHFDPETERRDSVFLGEQTHRSFVIRYGDRGYSVRGVPYQPSPVTVVNPDGGLWRSDGSVYRIVRLDEMGDTTMILEADVPPPPVTDDDRRAFIDRMTEDDESALRAAEAIVGAMPATKPAISGLIVDDLGRLWVRMGGAEEGEPRYDVFTREGDFVMTVELDFRPSQYLPLEIRDGDIYALVRDDLDVPYVVRAAIGGGGQEPETQP